MFKKTLFALLLWQSTAALALTYYGEAADGWRPRCLSTGTRTNIFFWWEETQFIQRKIWARRRDFPCHQWRRAASVSLRSWVEVPPFASHVFGQRLGDDAMEALEQVRFGTKIIRFERTAAEWLRRNPIASYTFRINEWLTRTHGLGFSGEVYRAWLDAKPENQRMSATYRRLLETIPRDPRAGEDLARRHPNVVLLVSLGMGWNPSRVPPGSTIEVFMREHQRFGFPMKILRNHPSEDIWGNVGILHVQVEEELAAGKDVILVGISKGSPELLAALSLATRRYLTPDRRQTNRPPGRGRVLAYANLSGAIGGTYIADRFKALPFNQWAAPILETFGRSRGRDISGTLNQLAVMDRASMERFNQRLWIDKVPADTIYVTGVGISTGRTGMRDTEDPFTLSIRRRAISLGLIRAANDGYVDYPGIELPEGTGIHQYTISFDSSHILWDGYFDGIPLNSPEMRRAQFLGLFTALLEH